jgi:hypothetical protein
MAILPGTVCKPFQEMNANAPRRQLPGRFSFAKIWYKLIFCDPQTKTKAA